VAVNGNNHSIDYTDEDGVVTNIEIQDLETTTTLVVNIPTQTITYTNEDGTVVTANIKDLETTTSIALSGSVISYINEDGITTAIDIKDAETTTTLTTTGSTFTYTDEDGTDTVIDVKNLETLTTLVQNANGTLTYTDEDGATTTVTAKSFVEGASDISVTGTGTSTDPFVVSFTEHHSQITNTQANGKVIATFTNENGDGFTIKESITELSLNTNSLDFKNENGITTNIDLSGYLDNTDNQTLSLSGTNLILSNGNTQSLASIID